MVRPWGRAGALGRDPHHHRHTAWFYTDKREGHPGSGEEIERGGCGGKGRKGAIPLALPRVGGGALWERVSIQAPAVLGLVGWNTVSVPRPSQARLRAAWPGPLALSGKKGKPCRWYYHGAKWWLKRN